ncbi:MAG: DUF3631 domain-containing protein [Chloroflexi bacterium]|nr:DUF3631 domain-containing protein [Chloroflexota bacterium]
MEQHSAEQEIVARLERVSGPDARGWWTALCVYHDDRKHPNLRVSAKGFSCMACGAKGGLNKLAVKLGIERPHPERERSTTMIATYDYRDEQGQLLFQVVRYQPKAFRQRRPDGSGGWTWNLDGVRRVPYRLPELLAAPPGTVIYVVEGEKAANALAGRGLVATCSPHGAGKWRGEYASAFAGRQVVILPDQDAPGKAHVAQVVASLFPVAETVKVVELPGLAPGEDVYDWLARGHTAADLARLVADAQLWRPLDGAGVLDAIAAFLRRFLVLSLHQAHAIALWVVHTHAFAAAEATPYLSITSPEKRSGKTRLLEVLELLVARPWLTGRVTAAVLARKVDAECPTLLLDESDAAFKGDREYAETLRALLNSGHRRGGKASVCVGQGAAISFKDLSTFCPKAIAGIGKLPDTVADRSIPIALKRRAPEEPVERFRRRKAEREATPIGEEALAWVATTSLAGAEPYLPQELDDRAADCWEPLLAIADAAGSEWPRRAREAAVALMAGEERQLPSLGVRLLGDVRAAFGNDAGQLPTSDLVQALLHMEEAPWDDLRGRPLDARSLASLLRPYGIHSSNIRIADRTPKGYKRDDFLDAWARYTPQDGASSATPPHTRLGFASARRAADPPQTPPRGPHAEDPPRASNRFPAPNVADVADKTGEKARKLQELLSWWMLLGHPTIPHRPGETIADLATFLTFPVEQNTLVQLEVCLLGMADGLGLS